MIRGGAMYTEIVKIIEGGMIGDKEKVYNYARVLAENLERRVTYVYQDEFDRC